MPRISGFEKVEQGLQIASTGSKITDAIQSPDADWLTKMGRILPEVNKLMDNWKRTQPMPAQTAVTQGTPPPGWQQPQSNIIDIPKKDDKLMNVFKFLLPYIEEHVAKYPDDTPIGKVISEIDFIKAETVKTLLKEYKNQAAAR